MQKRPPFNLASIIMSPYGLMIGESAPLYVSSMCHGWTRDHVLLKLSMWLVFRAVCAAEQKIVQNCAADFNLQMQILLIRTCTSAAEVM